MSSEADGTVCINDVLTDDELRAVLSRLSRSEDRDGFGLVCKRWLYLQSTERRRLRARAGPAMLRRMAGRFPGIVELDLSQSACRSFYPGVTDSDLAVIAAGFPCLRAIHLQECKGVMDAGMIELSRGLTSLQLLDVSHCRYITDKGMTAIARCCPSLKKLVLTGCWLITDALLEELSKSCSHLEQLVLLSCRKITDSGITILFGSCRQIKHLELSKCGAVGDCGIPRIAKTSLSSLRTLKLVDCPEVGDKSLFTLSNCCLNLEKLCISGCLNVTDEGIKSLALSCGHSLKILYIDWCVNISDISLGYVFSKCRYLVALNISGCHMISNAAFQVLNKQDFASGLRVLKMDCCPNLSVSTVAAVLQFCKELEYLDVRSCHFISKEGCEEAGLQFPECCTVKFIGSLSDSDQAEHFF